VLAFAGKQPPQSLSATICTLGPGLEEVEAPKPSRAKQALVSEVGMMFIISRTRLTVAL
jgi:hypothetical protein